MDESPTTPVIDDWVRRLRDPSARNAALEELREILMRGLRRAFGGKGGGDSFCEDVTQETLVRILDKLDQFAGRSKFTTWATSIGVRIGTSQFRRKMFQDVSLNSVDSGDNMRFQFSDESTAPADQTHQRNELLLKLREIIDTKLSDRQRQAVDAILHGMPVEEIAARSDSNRNAVYKLIHDARTRLKQGLEQAGYSADAVATALST